MIHGRYLRCMYEARCRKNDWGETTDITPDAKLTFSNAGAAILGSHDSYASSCCRWQT